MNDLEIPIALDRSKQPVHPFEWKEENDPHTCPECEKPVYHVRSFTREGVIEVRAHFAHHPNERGSCGCGTGESEIHKLAKLFVARYINEARAGDRDWPIYESACKVCKYVTKFPVPKPNGPVRPEFTLPSGRRLDVGREKYGIEIYKSNEVTREKEGDLKRDGVQWIELYAARLIARPEEWVSSKPHESDDCIKCHAKILAQQKKDIDVIVHNQDRIQKRLDEMSAEIGSRIQTRDALQREIEQMRTRVARTETEALAKLEEETRAMALHREAIRDEIAYFDREKAKAFAEIDQVKTDGLAQLEEEILAKRAELAQVQAELREARELQERGRSFLGKNFKNHAEMAAWFRRVMPPGT
jgi:hypothetical protein